MTLDTIDHELAIVAFERVGGDDFEQFVNAFYPSIAGEDFVPLGGLHDGGADAFQESIGWEGKSSHVFYQSSVSVDHRTKIKKNVKRLREFGRNVTAIVYVTSKLIQHIDVEEDKLSKKLSCRVRIRDRAFLVSHVNDSIATRAAFRKYLNPSVAFLKKVGGSHLLHHSAHVTSPEVYVFLQQEIERREGKINLVNAMTDGLVIWALEGTDPDCEEFRSRDEILDTILAEVPSAQRLIEGALDARLQALATKSKAIGRSIRWHRDIDKYCLAFEIRKTLERENLKEESLRVAVLEEFVKRMQNEYGEETEPELLEQASTIALDTIQRTFESMGLELSAFLQEELYEANLQTVSDHVDDILPQSDVPLESQPLVKEIILFTLQKAFYASTEEERLFFHKLSSTYTLLFCLHSDPKIVSYFQEMATDFCLYVGSDILIRALSERYLHLEDQATRNTLKLISDAGGKLILTEPVLDEVCSHLRATDREFSNFYSPIENSIDSVIAKNSDRILIRAYFYSRFDPPTGVVGPKNWLEFINQICDYQTLHTNYGKEQVHRYFMAEYRMEYEDAKDLAQLCDMSAVGYLANTLSPEKKDRRLAENDALLVYSVYGRRRELRESKTSSEFGFRTWWLTSETRILKHTGNIVGQEGARYMMRPEFLLNFLTLAPSASSIRRTYKSIFPSVLGLRLSRRVSQDEIRGVLKSVAEASKLDDGRREAAVSILSDRLKSDYLKKYPNQG